MIPKEIVDEIFQTARVEEVIGDFVSLKKSGSNYKAKSPFVDERTPSFMVSPAKNIWKCFSSGKGGNAVTFLMEHEHFSYVEALRWLASKYNIQVPEEKERTAEEIAQASLRENLSIVNEYARDHFVHNLFENQQGKAIGLSYFKERGFTEETIRKFQLGYCLDEFDVFTKAAQAKGYKLEYLVESGLTKSKEDKNFDFFKGRVMFPIHSVAGKVLGFGGRTLRTDKKVAKYFNSPESELYNKSKILYGLYFAKTSIIKYDRCFLVEGYTDVISMHQSGIENVVASSGTALTTEQIKLIKRYSENITILYDGDAAGIRASFRGIDMILEAGMNVKVVLFPEGEDPDSFAKKSTETELIDYIDENAQDFIVFKTQVLKDEAKNDPIKKAELIREIVSSIAIIPDAIKRQVYTRESSALFEIDEQILINELNKIRRGNIAKELKSPELNEIPLETIKVEQKKTATKIDLIYPQEKDIIRILLNYGINVLEISSEDEDGKLEKIKTTVIELVVHELEKDQIKFQNPVFNLMYAEYKSGIEENILYADTHFINHQNPEISSAAVNIATSKYEVSPKWTEKKVYISSEIDRLPSAVMSAIFSYKNAIVKQQIEIIQKELIALGSNGDAEEVNLLLAKQRKLERAKMLFSKKLGRIIS